MIPKRETSFDKERLRLAGLCAKSEQCEFDIRKKLERTSLSVSEKNEIIDFLKSNRFIDHQRYSGSFIRDKIRFAKWGKLKIRYHLLSKRIKSEIFMPILEEIDEEEYLATAYSLLESKSRGLNLNKIEDVAKLYRSMSTRGFETSVIKKAMNKLKSQND